MTHQPDKKQLQKYVGILMTCLGGLGVLIYLDLARNAIFHRGPERGEAWILFGVYGSVLLILSILYLIPGILLLKRKPKALIITTVVLLIEIIGIGVWHCFYPPFNLIIDFIGILNLIILILLFLSRRRVNKS